MFFNSKDKKIGTAAKQAQPAQTAALPTVVPSQHTDSYGGADIGASAQQQPGSLVQAIGGDEQTNGTAAPAQPDPEILAKIAAVRTKLHETFGKVALAMMSVPRYRNLSISDLNHLILDPLMRDRIAIATSVKDGEAIEGSLSGIAFWASVSEEVDVKIREQIKAGIFPVRLKTEDWNSGSINWLFDVIAPNARLTTAVIANFRQVLPKAGEGQNVKAGDMRIHPIVSRLVDPDALKKMGASPISASGNGAATNGASS